MTNHRDGDPVDVLLVEDNPGDVRLTKEAFKEGNINNTLHVATDGEEALDFLYRRGDHEAAPRPSIILLDLNLPKVDGRDVLKRIKDDPDLKTIPVIVLTSSEAHEDRIKCYENYANAYLTKPVDPSEFISCVGELGNFWCTLVKLPSIDDQEKP